jgi:hypothetical protein
MRTSFGDTPVDVIVMVACGSPGAEGLDPHDAKNSKTTSAASEPARSRRGEKDPNRGRCISGDSIVLARDG